MEHLLLSLQNRLVNSIINFSLPLTSDSSFCFSTCTYKNSFSWISRRFTIFVFSMPIHFFLKLFGHFRWLVVAHHNNLLSWSNLLFLKIILILIRLIRIDKRNIITFQTLPLIRYILLWLIKLQRIEAVAIEIINFSSNINKWRFSWINTCWQMQHLIGLLDHRWWHGHTILSLIVAAFFKRSSCCRGRLLLNNLFLKFLYNKLLFFKNRFVLFVLQTD